jgi:polyisoprenoid-binding protein YceI
MTLGTRALLLAIALTLPSVAARAEFRNYVLDPEHTSIGFLVHHIGYADTLGLFTEVTGSFAFDETAPAVRDVRVTVRAASVFTNSDRRDDHARGGDFLDAGDHPDIVFVGRQAVPTGERTGTITGDLTLRGVAREVTFDLVWNKAGLYPFDPTGGGNPPYVVGVSARATIQRSDFGMTYAVEPGWVGDEIELIIEFEAIRQD